MTAAHFIFIPGVLTVGLVIGWVLGSRAARDAFATWSETTTEERIAVLERIVKRYEVLRGTLPYSWDDLVRAAAGTADGTADRAITGFSLDTRALKQGEVFVALKDVRDGHEFVGAAFKAGAAAARADGETTDGRTKGRSPSAIRV